MSFFLKFRSNILIEKLSRSRNYLSLLMFKEKDKYYYYLLECSRQIRFGLVLLDSMSLGDVLQNSLNINNFQ